MSEVNVGEFFYLAAKAFGVAAAEIALQRVHELPIEIVPVKSGDAMLAARLKARFPISYAHCFCANLAIVRNAPVITGDPDFLRLQQGGLLTVEWLGA